MKKLAVIRGKDIARCPYGLPITAACKDVGDTILTMQALEYVDDKELSNTLKHNKIIYLTKKTGERCRFANDIMDKFDKVECSWGDTAAGEGVHYLTPSPLYPRNFIGDNVNPSPRDDGRGVNITDPRYYFDEPARGIDVPFGMYSVFANKHNEERLVHIAEKYTNKIVNIKDKLAILRNKYFDALKLVVASNNAIILNDQQLEQILFIINDWCK